MTHKLRTCKCEKCREKKAEYNKEYREKNKTVSHNRFYQWKCQWPNCNYFAAHTAKRGIENPKYYICGRHLKLFRLLRNEILEKMHWKPREYRPINMPGESLDEKWS
jgi:hypothetical protein